jgi:hypothetical protein
MSIATLAEPTTGGIAASTGSTHIQNLALRQAHAVLIIYVAAVPVTCASAVLTLADSRRPRVRWRGTPCS